MLQWLNYQQNVTLSQLSAAGHSDPEADTDRRNLLKGEFFGFFFLMYVIQRCFICRSSDSTVSEDARIEPRTVATLALTVICSNHLAR
jgi:hypothetical protein